MNHMNPSEINRRRFLATSLTAASAVSLAGWRLNAAPGENSIKPKFVHLANAAALAKGECVKGPARVLELKGRKGINPTSIHTAIKLTGGHTLNEPRGTLAPSPA